MIFSKLLEKEELEQLEPNAFITRDKTIIIASAEKIEESELLKKIFSQEMILLENAELCFEEYAGELKCLQYPLNYIFDILEDSMEVTSELEAFLDLLSQFHIDSIIVRPRGKDFGWNLKLLYSLFRKLKQVEKKVTVILHRSETRYVKKNKSLILKIEIWRDIALGKEEYYLLVAPRVL